MLNGLNKDISNMVELQHYIELEDLVYMATKVKRLLKRNSSTCQWDNSGSFYQRLNYRRDEAASSKSNTMESKVEPLKALRKDLTAE